jgi:hypothetical protein
MHEDAAIRLLDTPAGGGIQPEPRRCGPFMTELYPTSIRGTGQKRWLLEYAESLGAPANGVKRELAQNRWGALGFRQGVTRITNQRRLRHGAPARNRAHRRRPEPFRSSRRNTETCPAPPKRAWVARASLPHIDRIGANFIRIEAFRGIPRSNRPTSPTGKYS